METSETIATNVETHIISLQREWMDACLKKRRYICDKILSDDFILHRTRGMTKTKVEWMEDLIIQKRI